MKILYNSVSPTVKSGYGRCTAELVYRLLKKHEVDVFAYYGIQLSNLEITLSGKEGERSVRIIGGNGTIYHPLIKDKQYNYDIMLAHWDLWMSTFNPSWLSEIKIPIIWWAIIDHDPLAFPVRRLMNYPKFMLAVPMTEWGRRVMLKCPDVDPEKVAEPIPHGISPEEWKPVENPKIPNIPDEADFVVCSVVANHGMRENIPTMIEAFAIFLKETKADAYYYIHAEPFPHGTGYNLYEVVKAVEEIYGIDLKRRIVFKKSIERYPDEFLRNVYSRADVHLITIMGGSFEVPILEAACCGTPSITTGNTPMAEIVGYGERGLIVEPVGSCWMNLASSRQWILNPKDIAQALLVYFEDEELRKKHARKMLEWIEKNATWDIVAERWIKLLDEVWESYTSYGKYYYLVRDTDLSEWNYFRVHGRVLELGCGCGELLEYLSRSCEAYGIEISDYAIEKCKNKGLNVFKADASNLPFKNDSFDYVISQHLLEHLDDPLKAVKESVRVARKKAIHIIPAHRSADATHKISYFTKEMIDEICRKLVEEGYDVVAYPEPSEDHPEADWVIEVSKLTAQRQLPCPRF